MIVEQASFLRNIDIKRISSHDVLGKVFVTGNDNQLNSAS